MEQEAAPALKETSHVPMMAAAGAVAAAVVGYFLFAKPADDASADGIQTQRMATLRTQTQTHRTQTHRTQGQAQQGAARHVEPRQQRHAPRIAEIQAERAAALQREADRIEDEAAAVDEAQAALEERRLRLEQEALAKAEEADEAAAEDANVIGLRHFMVEHGMGEQAPMLLAHEYAVAACAHLIEYMELPHVQRSVLRVLVAALNLIERDAWLREYAMNAAAPQRLTPKVTAFRHAVTALGNALRKSSLGGAAKDEDDQPVGFIAMDFETVARPMLLQFGDDTLANLLSHSQIVMGEALRAHWTEAGSPLGVDEAHKRRVDAIASRRIRRRARDASAAALPG